MPALSRIAGTSRLKLLLQGARPTSEVGPVLADLRGPLPAEDGRLRAPADVSGRRAGGAAGAPS